MNTIDIEIDYDTVPMSLEEIQLFVERVLAYLDMDNKEMAVTLCNDERMTAINGEYRQRFEPTDILSFPQQEEIDIDFPNDDNLLGDLIISIDTLKRNAEYFTVDEAEELKRLLIHGILHLIGMDHTTNNADEEMLQYQERILSDMLRKDVE